MENKMTTRYLSLDVLRGLTVALMIVVNTPGSWSHIYAPLKHADWHGFTPTDWVFPTFLFVVGNALSFSMKRLDTVAFSTFLKKVLKRTTIIFVIGVLLNLFPFFQIVDGNFEWKNFAEVRIWGVLQRIAVCYMFGSLIIYYFRSTAAIIGISSFLLMSYWGILYYFGQQDDPYSLEGNAVTHLDNFLFHAKNLYQGYGIPFEPEGVLSTPPSIVFVLVGYLTGRYLQQKGNTLPVVFRLVWLGIALLVLGYVWDPYFPINKPIWTSSYVVFSLGWDLIITGLLVWIIEIKSYRKWTYFFEVFGKNPLFIYILAWVIIKILSMIRIDGTSLTRMAFNGLSSILPDKTASLAYAIVYTLLL